MKMLQLPLLAALSIVLFTGCGDDNRSSTDTGIMRVDGGHVDSGPLPDTGPVPDTGPLPDSGTSTGMCPAGMCNILTASGCATGQGCYFLSMMMGGTPEPLCDTAGTSGDGATCATYADCQEGFFCEGTTCRHYCCGMADTGCPTGQTCAVQLVGPGGVETGVGFCKLPDTCDPITQTGCAMGQGCYTQGSDGSVICIGSLHDAAEGTTCMASNDCAPGLQCYGAGGADPVCHKFCNVMTMTGCGMGQTCDAVGIMALPNLGICTPAATP